MGNSSASARASSLLELDHLVTLALDLACMTLVWSSGHLSRCVGVSMLVPAVGDSICRHDESALTSAGEPSESSGDWLPSVSSVLHSLLLGKVWTGYYRS